MADVGALSPIATNCKRLLLERVTDYVRDSVADNTRRAYLSDLAHFEGWGGTLPASAETVAVYLVAHAKSHSVATLLRRLATISKVHRGRGLPDPARAELVRATMRGIKRTRGAAQREAKPLIREDLFLVLDAMGDRPKDARDKALLLIGFARRLAGTRPSGSRIIVVHGLSPWCRERPECGTRRASHPISGRLSDQICRNVVRANVQRRRD